MIREVVIDNDITHIKMLLTTPFCPYGPAMIDETRQKATEARDKPANVELSMDAWDFSMMEDPTALEWGMYN